jgi:glycosyltransferase involved in cell wall biosynthesis
MTEQPLVSIICLCYNHAAYVHEALQSVRAQTYTNFELIVVDDGSSDQSVSVIRSFLSQVNDARISFIQLSSNIGYCRAFNIGYKQSSGQYIIDLAADDLLLSTRIASGVDTLLQHGEAYGVNFSDAELINEKGHHLSNHSDRFPHHAVPQGDVYQNLISRYFICSPTMLVSRKLLEDLGGYDEALAYEDFDLWMRGSRNYRFCYTPEVLVKKRILASSMSAKQFTRKDTQRLTTYAVCVKILKMNRTKDEDVALRKRICYEMRLCLQVFDISLIRQYWSLLRSIPANR